MGKSKKKKRQNQWSNFKKGKPQQDQDVVLAGHDELLGKLKVLYVRRNQLQIFKK